MNKNPIAVLLSILLVVSSFPAIAAEYFVTKQGNDANNGTSKPTAFLTIQKGVDALAPGDTLTIGRGEYFETVKRDGLGSMDAETIIRAELPGTVLLRGDLPIASSAFKKVDGFRYIYAADFDREVQAIHEVDTLTRARVFPALSELEYSPGTSHYDAAKKKLYISTSDLQPPDRHQYRVSVLAGNGLLLLNPRRVTVDGIAAGGFQNNTMLDSYPGYNANWGIILAGARGCIIRNCTAFFNGGGIAIHSGKIKEADNGWNLIEKCTAYANGSLSGAQGGNIASFSSNHDEIRDVLSYRSNHNGIRLYGAGVRGPAILRNSIAWGNALTDVFLKGGEIEKYGLTENTITMGVLHSHNVKNSLVGTVNQYNPKPPADTVTGVYSTFVKPEVARANRNQWFADAENLDFRLQPTSPYRGKGPNGADRGPFQYQPNIFYVTPGGSDSNDGLSTKKPWKTLAHAMKQLCPGDTLYLEGGTYDAAGELKVANAEGQRTAIRGRGNSTVLIRGNIAVTGSRGLEFERLNFTGALSLSDSRDIKFKSCRFAGQSTSLAATNVENLKVTHSEFTGFNQAAVQLSKSTLVWLAGNIFDNKTAPAIHAENANAILYSDYNSYANADNAWRVANATLKLADLPDLQDKYSVVQAPEYSVQNGLPVLQNAADFSAGGPHATSLGFYRVFHKQEMRASSPQVHSVSDTAANLEWWSSVPAITKLAWGETPDTPHKVVFNKDAQVVTDGFNTYTLNGLKPGTKYYFRLLSAKPLEEEDAQFTEAVTLKDAPISFETPRAAAAARVLYVAPDGDDKNNGLSRAQAWRTVEHAGNAARAGDSVQIAGGTYNETVRVRAGGSPGRPITFQAIPGEKVIFDGDNRLIPVAFSVSGKQHIRFDGLYLKGYAGHGGKKSIIDLSQSQHIEITRCFFNGEGKGLSGTQISADQCSDITIRNNVIARGMQGTYFRGTSNLFIENNLFLNNHINAIMNSGGDPKSIHVKNNLFVDSIPSKVKVQLFEIGGFEQYVFDNNAFYLRIPDAERKVFLLYGSGPGRISVADYDQRAGTKNIIVDDPLFPITLGKEPKDYKGNKLDFLGDWIATQNKLDWPDVFATHPELKARKIGLLPEAFEGFYFHKAQ